MTQKTTRLMRVGRPETGWVNIPPIRGSTYTFASIEQWRDTRTRRETERLISYGARGNDTGHALEDALVELEAGHRACLFPTGQAAIATVLAGLLAPGDHILITDAAYEPVRNFCKQYLERIGVQVQYYLPDGSDIASLMRPGTKVVYVESPGTATYDMVDLPAVARVAQTSGAVVVADNTWGSGWLYRPLALGADISIIAATKYVSGHSDLVMGAVISNESLWPLVQRSAITFGQTIGGDDAFLALRGLRTMPLRLREHGANAIEVARWLELHPAVSRIYCPAFESDPSHALWKRDCHGTNGLLTVEFNSDWCMHDVEKLIDSLDLFGLGSSWGGFESLVLPVDLTRTRTRQLWHARGPMMRLHIGLEDPADLISDLEQAIARGRQ